MPTSLAESLTSLQFRLSLLERAFGRNSFQPDVKRTIDRFALQEGLISQLWQAWGRYAREILIKSASGALTANGQPVTSPHAGRPEAQLTYIAARLAKREQVGTIRALSGSHLEPTWGDLSKLNLIAAGLQTTNSSTLLSAFGSAPSVRDLQTARNASAHYCADRIADVRAARVRYNRTSFRHPSDMMFWIEPVSQDPLWRVWVGEIETAAIAASL